MGGGGWVLTLDVWLENKKVVQSTGAGASLPICPPLGRLCPHAPPRLLASSVQGPGPRDGRPQCRAAVLGRGSFGLWALRLS